MFVILENDDVSNQCVDTTQVLQSNENQDTHIDVVDTPINADIHPFKNDNFTNKYDNINNLSNTNAEKDIVSSHKDWKYEDNVYNMDITVDISTNGNNQYIDNDDDNDDDDDDDDDVYSCCSSINNVDSYSSEFSEVD